MSRVHLPSVLIAAALTLAFLMFAPAPQGCGCAERKRKLEEMGGRVFG